MKPEKIVKGLTDYLISRDITYELALGLDNSQCPRALS